MSGVVFLQGLVTDFSVYSCLQSTLKMGDVCALYKACNYSRLYTVFTGNVIK
jgi:hypothetical protein